MGHGVAERHTPAIAASNGEASGQGLGAKLFGGNPAASAGGSQNPKGSGPCARQGRSPLGSDYRMPKSEQKYQEVKRMSEGCQAGCRKEVGRMSVRCRE